MHGLREKLEQEELQHVVGLIGNLLMLSWINWSNILLSHGDQSKQALRVLMDAFVIWWIKMGFFMAKRLPLPIIRCRGYLFHYWFSSIKRTCRAVSNAYYGRDWLPTWSQLWSYKCQGNMPKWFLSTFFSEIHKQCHICFFLH